MATATLELAAPSPTRTPTSSKPALIALSLLSVYVVWGSTYFAMRVALDFLPPFLMAATRFSIAGLILLVVLRLQGAPWPTAKQWGAAGLVGVLLLTLGNALIAIAEQSVDSGVAATVVATTPLWAAGFGALWGDRPSARELLGLVAGFAGVAVLNHGGSLSFGSLDTLALLIAPLSWALGSMWSRRLPVPPGLMNSAAQMIVASAVMFGIAFIRGDRPVGPPTFATVGALGYLITFGSLLGFSAYGYLLRHTRPAVATSYAYVNPIIALGIGAGLGGEHFTWTKVIACGLTVAGVGVVTLWKTPRA